MGYLTDDHEPGEEEGTGSDGGWVERRRRTAEYGVENDDQAHHLTPTTNTIISLCDAPVTTSEVPSDWSTAATGPPKRDTRRLTGDRVPRSDHSGRQRRCHLFHSGSILSGPDSARIGQLCGTASGGVSHSSRFPAAGLDFLDHPAPAEATLGPLACTAFVHGTKTVHQLRRRTVTKLRG